MRKFFQTDGLLVPELTKKRENSIIKARTKKEGFLMKVTKESIIGDVLDYNAGTAKFFFEIGMHCLGCPASRGESIADTAARYGFYFYPGDHKRIPGWMQVRYRLQFDPAGYPRMYFFNTCRAAIRTLPTLLYSTLNPEDLDSDGEDHAADEIRYLCMAKPVKPWAGN